MTAVVKKMAKSASNDTVKKPKKQSLKKVQKTAEILAAKKLAKLKATKAVSASLNRAPLVKKQRAKHQFEPTRLNRGVLLIKNLPKGFFEDQLKKYFTQYGRVTRLRVARSERTGGSKGYAYVEFKYPEVAKVAAEAMDNYLMFRQRLKTVYISPDEQDHDYFKQPVKFVKKKNGSTKLVTPATIRAAKAVAKYNKPVSDEVAAERIERSKYKLTFLQKKLEKAGINVDLSSQLYVSEKGKGTEKGASNTTNTSNDKKSKASKLAKNKNNANTTLENLLENTIQTSDEEDDDYIAPSTPELDAKKKKKTAFITTEQVTSKQAVKVGKKSLAPRVEKSVPEKKQKVKLVKTPQATTIKSKNNVTNPKVALVKNSKKMKKTK